MGKPNIQQMRFKDPDEFFERLRQNERPVVVDFWADWCGPCHAIAPILDGLSEEYQDQVDVWKVNTDDNRHIMIALHIRGIPTLIAFYQGKEMSRRVGAAPKPMLETLFKTALSGEKGAPAPTDRRMRILLAVVFLVFGLFGNFEPALQYGLLAVAALMFLWAYYDLLPFWEALRARLRKNQD